MNKIRSGEALRRLREERGFTLRGLSDAVSAAIPMDESVLASWEAGEFSPTLEQASAVAKELGVSIDELTGGEYVPKLRFGEVSGEAPVDIEQQLELHHEESRRLYERGRLIVKIIIIVEAAFTAISMLRGFNLLALALEIALIVCLWKGKAWARWVYVALSALGIIGDLFTTARYSSQLPIWLTVILLLFIAYRIAVCILLGTNRAVKEFLYDQSMD
ncbi:MAG: helix-turn-helix transcriptional regulator [Clostridia bacterium]|nr:helix-turn-helix transcriptional regulator [Clostridia bacterium]